MTEILTESFCERCGTRYTFESARPKTRLKGVKVLSRGLKNFVLSDDTSIDEAMAAARSETDREASAHQLDAFHKTFNFCMSCRQYTCPNCWNETEARCLSCAPLSLVEAPLRLEDLATGLIGEVSTGNGTEAIHEPHAWPDSVAADVAVDAPAEMLAPAEADFLSGVELETLADEPGAAAAAERAELADLDASAEPDAALTAAEAEPALEPTAEPLAAAELAGAPEADADAASKAAAQTTGLLQRFRPGQSLDAELDAFERERSDVAATTPAEDTTDVAIEAVAVARAEEPVAANAEPTLEPVAAEEATEEPVAAEAPTTPTETVPEPELEPLAAGAGADLVEQPTWRITAPDPTGAPPLPPSSEPGATIPLQATAAQTDAPGAEPQWPARPQWPGATPDAGLPFLGRPAAGQGGIEALWAASNQELVTAAPTPGRPAASTGIQPCISCGLSLSANARFCRRCGTLQGR